MSQKSPWLKSLIVLIVGGGVLGCLAIGAVVILRSQFGAQVPGISRLLAANTEPPTVSIIQPTQSPTIVSGQGVMVVSQARSKSGLQRMEILIDGSLAQNVLLNLEGEVEKEVQYAWFASKAGDHMLSVIAYDDLERASEPASLMMNVSSNRHGFDVLEEAEEESEQEQAAGENGEDAAEEEESESEVPPSEAAPPEEESGEEAAPSEAETEEEPLPETEAEEEPPSEPEAEEEPPPEPEAEDQPPVIPVFEVGVTLFAHPASANIHLEATDDRGLVVVILDIFSEYGDHENLVHPCGSEVTCTLDYSIELDTGQWWFTAQAYDNAGQVSIPVFESREVLSLSDIFPPIWVVYDILPFLPPEPEDIISPIFEVMEYIEILSGIDFDLWIPAGDEYSVLDNCKYMSVYPLYDGRKS